MRIRKYRASDMDDIMAVERAAFDSDEEANLVRELLSDPSAEPIVSLLAFSQGRAVGHILFTGARLDTDTRLSMSILAPLAVVPDAQNQGIGSELVRHGFKVLSESGVDMVFVLGHPNYYPRFGFEPAGGIGFEAPFPIPIENSDAWMVHALKPDAMGSSKGKVICADKLNNPAYWRE
jgi:putative acetyltransferase